jgi:hypothetical protein
MKYESPITLTIQKIWPDMGRFTLKNNALHYHYFKNLALPLPLLYFLKVMHYITITWVKVMHYHYHYF